MLYDMVRILLLFIKIIVLYLSIMECIMKTYSDLIQLLQSKGFSTEEAESFVKIEKNMKGLHKNNIEYYKKI